MIADQTGIDEPTLGAAYVALFVLQACLRRSDSPDPPPSEFAFGADGSPVSTEILATTLAQLPKPAFIDGTVRAGRVAVTAGPLSDRPQLQEIREHLSALRSRYPDRHPFPSGSEVIVCFTDIAGLSGLRIHANAFERFRSDYVLANSHGFGMDTDATRFGRPFGLAATDLVDVAGLIRVTGGGRFEVFEGDRKVVEFE